MATLEKSSVTVVELGPRLLYSTQKLVFSLSLRKHASNDFLEGRPERNALTDEGV